MKISKKIEKKSIIPLCEFCVDIPLILIVFCNGTVISVRYVDMNRRLEKSITAKIVPIQKNFGYVLRVVIWDAGKIILWSVIFINTSRRHLMLIVNRCLNTNITNRVIFLINLLGISFLRFFMIIKHDFYMEKKKKKVKKLRMKKGWNKC